MKYLITLILSIFFQTSVAQNLNIMDLLHIYKCSTNDADSYLIEKEWTFYDKGVFDNQTLISYSKKLRDKVTVFLRIEYHGKLGKLIKYNIHELANYSQVKNSLLKNEFKFVKDISSDNELRFLYSKDGFYILLESVTLVTVYEKSETKGWMVRISTSYDLINQ